MFGLFKRKHELVWAVSGKRVTSGQAIVFKGEIGELIGAVKRPSDEHPEGLLSIKLDDYPGGRWSAPASELGMKWREK